MKDSRLSQDVWADFLRKWPIKRLRTMTLQEYSSAGNDQTFTAWIESRLDKLGSIWGGSSFKFGVFSRRDKTPTPDGSGRSYSQDYAWYTKYGDSAEKAFARVRALVVEVAEAAARGDYASIDHIDLGEAYKWKIAFHYQDRDRPGIVAVFSRKRLTAWLAGRVGSVPDETSERHRQILSLREGKNLMELSKEVWEQTAEDGSASPVEPDTGDESTDEEFRASGAHPLNLILYGPPGTGKTYETAKLAVEICDGCVPETREALVARHRELRGLRRIRFVTFHPSFSYEEFVEGIRPASQGGQVRYDVRPGVLKEAVSYARELYEAKRSSGTPLELKGRRLFKMSLGDTSKSGDDWVYPECIDSGEVCIGFAPGTDFSSCNTAAAVRKRYVTGVPGRAESDFAATAIHRLKNEIRQGDLVVVSEGNRRFRAIAEVVGPYCFGEREEGYEHRRPVRWLWTSSESVPVDVVSSKQFSQVSIYLIDQGAVKWKAVDELLSPKRELGGAPKCVLVIDEINRANLAKTFGELITLLEPSKRLGALDEQEAELPYSGDLLGVPPNLHVIGTMNTADRSIALMDTALRRRFDFREMGPRADLLKEDVGGINLRELLVSMNERIENLFDRDHVLGHTYLMGISTFDGVVERLRRQIIPLLQEYFFEDWRQIQRVFNDVDQPLDQQIIQAVGSGEERADSSGPRTCFRVNPTIRPAAVQKIYA